MPLIPRRFRNQLRGIYWEGICGKSISIEPTSGVTVKADPGTDTVEPSIPDAAAALAAETTTTAKSPASTTNTVKKDPPKATASTKPSSVPNTSDCDRGAIFSTSDCNGKCGIYDCISSVTALGQLQYLCDFP
ncbi:MAG: hypothetical protein Q9200_000763 [Gallowayella weberi]